MKRFLKTLFTAITMVATICLTVIVIEITKHWLMFYEVNETISSLVSIAICLFTLFFFILLCEDNQ